VAGFWRAERNFDFAFFTRIIKTWGARGSSLESDVSPAITNLGVPQITLEVTACGFGRSFNLEAKC
jgi:hypothetical protein